MRILLIAFGIVALALTALRVGPSLSVSAPTIMLVALVIGVAFATLVFAWLIVVIWDLFDKEYESED